MWNFHELMFSKTFKMLPIKDIKRVVIAIFPFTTPNFEVFERGEVGQVAVLYYLVGDGHFTWTLYLKLVLPWT